MRKDRLRRALAAALLALAHPAAAQSLPDLVAAARARSLEVREQAAEITRARAERAAAGRALLPALTASGAYTRNQREVIAPIPTSPTTIEDILFVPVNQYDASGRVDVPLLDAAAWRKLDAADAQLAQARANAAAVADEVTRTTVRAWYDLVAADALRASALGTLEAGEATGRIVRVRVDAGLASRLDVERADAQTARDRQSVAEAEQARADAARTLRVLTGLAVVAIPLPDTELSPEAPLDTWLAAAESLPAVRAARAAAEAESANAAAAEAAWLPTIGAAAEERYTNAVGFGTPTNWSLGVTATWRLDATTPALAGAARARADAAGRRADRALRDARTDVEAAWEQVRALRARAAAALAEAEAAGRAVAIARADYPARASLLDVLLTERDAFSADAARIGALADLAYARAALRIAAGRGAELAR
jgi:outer membrane protein TolC